MHRAVLLWVSVVRFYISYLVLIWFFGLFFFFPMQEISHNLGVCYMYLKHFNKVMPVGSRKHPSNFTVFGSLKWIICSKILLPSFQKKEVFCFNVCF